MSVRLRCRDCKTTFLTEDDPTRKKVPCPKCGALQPVAQSGTETAGSVFVPADGAARPKRGRAFAVLGLLVVAAAGVGVVVAWPAIVRWWKPAPQDPVEYVATAYLQSLIDKNGEATGKLGVVELPPSIRSFRDVKRDTTRNARVKGSFAPITAFHKQVDADFTYDESAGRYVPKNALGPAAELLDAANAAKAKAEKDGIYQKMQSGNPEDIFDAAEGLGKAITSLAAGALSPRKILPTYAQLVEDAKPPLPDAEKALALHFGANRETWNALLKRPFNTLKSDGPFIFDRTEVTAKVVDALGSSGDPPTTLRLGLTRFRLENIDTEWRVTSAQRGDAPRAPVASPSESKPKRYESDGATGSP